MDLPIMHPEDDEDHRQHVQKIIAAFRHYRKYTYGRVDKSETYLNGLPPRHQDMLATYRTHLGVIRDCIDANQTVINKMLNTLFANSSVGDIASASSSAAANQAAATPRDSDGNALKIRHQDMENAQSTLKLIARDWSSLGAEEREQSYRPIIEAIEEFFKPGSFALNEVKILVPGAGLGRLSYDLACRGYDCEGNEFSYFMMIASNFVLNQCLEPNKYTLYPWIHQYTNNLRMEDQVAAIKFPDVAPVQNPPKGNISMAAGDFLVVYRVPNSYDCVATCFFIDCANNVVDFIETIYRILVPGGIWVNLGPLLYHFSDIQHEQSIEPTFENLMTIVEMVGFEVVRSKTGIRTKYAQNPKSMLKSEYESLFWICRKPLDAAPQASSSEGVPSRPMSQDCEDSTAYANGNAFRSAREEASSGGYSNGY